MTVRTFTHWLNGQGHAVARWLRAIPRLYRMILLTAIIVGIGVLLAQTTMAQRTARNAAQADAEAQAAVEALSQLVIDAETGQRGYLLTFDPAHLQPYERARNQLPDRLAAVKLLFMQNTDPAVGGHLAALDPLLADKFEELSSAISFARNGDQLGALEVVNGGRGKQVMDQLRGHFAALEQAQRAQRDQSFTAAFAAEDGLVPLLLALWLSVALVIWSGYTGERERALAEAEAAQAGQLRELNARNELLAKELAHRVKNLFGVALSIIGLSARRPGTTQEVIADISARLLALSRAQDVAVGPAAGEVQLRDLLTSLCAPYADNDAERVVLTGGQVTIPERIISTLALVVHELATNAAKYGAFSVADGRVEITWTAASADQPLIIEWRESGGPQPSLPVADPASAASGFGTRMTQAVLRQIGGTIEREWPASGALIRLTVPPS